MSELRQTLDDIALKVSKYIKEVRDEGNATKIIGYHSGDTTRLIDKRSEEYLFELLKDTGYKFKFVSEESGVSGYMDNYDYLAVIDPLDGSTNFVLDIPWFSVSVAIYDRKSKTILDSIAGFVINVPYNKVYSYDIRNAYVNGYPYNDKPNDLSLPKIVITYFEKDKVEKSIQILSKINGYKIRSLGSASLDMLLVCTKMAYLFFDLRGRLRNVDISASINFCKRLNTIATTLDGKEIGVGIDNVYNIDEIILSWDHDVLKRIYSSFS
ncbi:inositol monophosphatase [Sulfolobus sp. A20]|uniref:inositol monophosphatase family protein n=1 Tax=Sulfolobaceae TaxID=118883 RepID=UPI0008461EB3|nr:MULTISPECIES: inositol monophosphatase family protein [unclassified Sulfolobus]TRM74213.1 inositol monophosphatase [Sulfolobus sp. E5]TRM78411.1 inositol monophosphatase [Sulfolobus sp. A20-N-F8]TRM79877.1 inositol monophosphatase [Sulfolobus sp. D5]TRM81676.1 inositol monophosphatase [Sulfolobus sp. A20-N-F6]TRM89168.1 inositol monophosphatase [Sulfolobus sp. C3]TRM99960.1 inositol monophosphatase [Sulfolobus sp. E1]TRN03565.1 inositol monophosphatase [Sulfolobus sp. F1]